jgi:hypothetical protein
MIVNNEWLQGYLAALKNLELMTSSLKDNSLSLEAVTAYDDVLVIIEQVKNNYRLLVKELNETQSKKTTS